MHRHLPAYRRQPCNGRADRAFVVIDGRRHYLGRYGTHESRKQYDRLLAEWLGNDRVLPDTGGDDTVADLVARFWPWARSHYRRPDGTETNEPHNFRMALRPLVDIYGDHAATDFGPTQLRAVRRWMIERGWSRGFVNKSVGRIRRVFKWGVEHDLVPVETYQRLRTLTGLRPGRSDARETDPIRPVDDAIVDATIANLTPTLRAMVELQRATGMRPGEVCAMRPRDIRTGPRLWEYRPATHKTQHTGRERVILLGPKAQQTLRPFLVADLDAPLFSPKRSELERRGARHAQRTTPLSCGNRPGTNRKHNPAKTPGDRYDTLAYGKAIKAACDAAFPLPTHLAKRAGETAAAHQARLSSTERAEIAAWRRTHRWTPGQLRHAFATRVRREHGLEAAQVLLGHARADVTQVYAQRDLKRAEEIARMIG